MKNKIFIILASSLFLFACTIKPSSPQVTETVNDSVTPSEVKNLSPTPQIKPETEEDLLEKIEADQDNSFDQEIKDIETNIQQ